jgi:chromosome partitioning protein
LVLIPVAASHVDLWATDGVLDLAARERKVATIVLNRTKAGTRLGEEVAEAAAALEARVAVARLGQRVVFAETLGQGLGAQEAGRSAALNEVDALAEEVAGLL